MMAVLFALLSVAMIMIAKKEQELTLIFTFAALLLGLVMLWHHATIPLQVSL